MCRQTCLRRLYLRTEIVRSSAMEKWLAKVTSNSKRRDARWRSPVVALQCGGREPRRAQSQPSKAWRWRLRISGPVRWRVLDQLQRHFNTLRHRGFQFWQPGAHVRFALRGFAAGEPIEMIMQLIEHGSFEHDSAMVVACDRHVLLDVALRWLDQARSFTVLALGGRGFVDGDDGAGFAWPAFALPSRQSVEGQA